MGNLFRKKKLCGYNRGQLDVHERWQYLEINGELIQKLIRLIALCKNCHNATHMGLAEIRGQGPAMRAHIAKINNWSEERVTEHVQAAAARWEARSDHLWALDISLLVNAGYHPNQTPHAEIREAIAQTHLDDPMLNTKPGFYIPFPNEPITLKQPDSKDIL